MLEDQTEALRYLDQIEDSLEFDSTDFTGFKARLAEYRAVVAREEQVESEDILPVVVFPSTNRLCGIYNEVDKTLPNGQRISFRLSFCLPLILAPEPNVNVGFEILDELTIESVENRPEAPWVRKVSKSIQFTENILEAEFKEIDLDDIQEDYMNIIQSGNKENMIMNSRVMNRAKQLL
jgi:hypothetical protein